MPQSTPVTLDANLNDPTAPPIFIRSPLRIRLDLQIGTIGMSPNNLESLPRFVLFPHGEGDQSRFIPRKVIFSSRHDFYERVFPFVSIVPFDESSGFQGRRCGTDGVERIGRRIEKCHRVRREGEVSFVVGGERRERVDGGRW